jgi:hypothetical protein
MEKTANFISLRHAQHAPRRLRFVRHGRKGMHATGVFWGGPDWFDSLHPDATAQLEDLKVACSAPLMLGSVIDEVRIHEAAFAKALGLWPSPGRERRRSPPHKSEGLRLLALPRPRGALELRNCLKVRLEELSRPEPKGPRR